MSAIPFAVSSVKNTKTANRTIYEFAITDNNIDSETVNSFGDEWNAFHGFNDEDIEKLGNDYFDIVPETILNSQSKVLDIACGSGRFIKYLVDRNRVGSIVGADPSHAIYAADKLIGKNDKVSLIRASANDLPFEKESFDFVYCIGVLHHIPDTFKAMQGCVEHVKRGGYFLTYLYYDLDNRGIAFRTLFHVSNLFRRGISKLPKGPKKWICDLLAVGFYMPFVLFSRTLKAVGVSDKVRSKVPLYGYENKSFYIIRNDSLDRFGTPLEQRFTKKQITEMMEKCGLTDITFSNNIPFWHAVGRKS